MSNSKKDLLLANTKILLKFRYTDYSEPFEFPFSTTDFCPLTTITQKNTTVYDLKRDLTVEEIYAKRTDKSQGKVFQFETKPPMRVSITKCLDNSDTFNTSITQFGYANFLYKLKAATKTQRLTMLFCVGDLPNKSNNDSMFRVCINSAKLVASFKIDVYKYDTSTEYESDKKQIKERSDWKQIGTYTSHEEVIKNIPAEKKLKFVVTCSTVHKKENLKRFAFREFFEEYKVEDRE